MRIDDESSGVTGMNFAQEKLRLFWDRDECHPANNAFDAAVRNSDLQSTRRAENATHSVHEAWGVVRFTV